MAEITAEAVRALREKTDLPMMECKKALTEAKGDQDAAIRILRDRVKGLTIKMGDRVTSEGRMHTKTSADGMKAVMIEVQCETAPVARNEDFVNLCEQLATQLLEGPGAASPEELLKQSAPSRPGQTLQDLHDEVFNKMREKMVVARIVRVDGPVASYTHHDGTLGVLFQAKGDKATHEVLRDVCMHIAALNPVVCFPEQLDPELVNRQKERESAEARASGKPESIIEKIVAGKMRQFFATEKVLVEQPFAKDDSKTVSQALGAVGLSAVGFTRWRLGNK